MDIAALEKMLAEGKENALLQQTLGGEYLKQGDAARAAEHLARAVELAREYSAAWKLYGKALTALERYDEAAEVYAEGIAVAEERGDIQAAKEMKVFLKRLQKGVV